VEGKGEGLTVDGGDGEDNELALACVKWDESEGDWSARAAEMHQEADSKDRVMYIKKMIGDFQRGADWWLEWVTTGDQCILRGS